MKYNSTILASTIGDVTISKPRIWGHPLTAGDPREKLIDLVQEINLLEMFVKQPVLGTCDLTCGKDDRHCASSQYS